MQSHCSSHCYVSVSKYKAYFTNPGHFHSVIKENHLTLQYSGCTGRDSNHEPLEYKSEASSLETNKYIWNFVSDLVHSNRVLGHCKLRRERTPCVEIISVRLWLSTTNNICPPLT
jgi:hypothetical protein